MSILENLPLLGWNLQLRITNANPSDHKVAKEVHLQNHHTVCNIKQTVKMIESGQDDMGQRCGNSKFQTV